jgi:hypothetical protein
MTNAKRLRSPAPRKALQTTRPASNKTKPEWVIEGTGKNTYTVLNGVRIAKLGKPGTRQAGKWIPLKPGYEVVEGDGFSAIVIDKFEPPTK